MSDLFIQTYAVGDDDVTIMIDGDGNLWLLPTDEYIDLLSQRCLI